MTKIDLDELERGLRENRNARPTREEALALIARVRELEAACRCAAVALRMHQGSSPTAKETDSIVERGMVLR